MSSTSQTPPNAGEPNIQLTVCKPLHSERSNSQLANLERFPLPILLSVRHIDYVTARAVEVEDGTESEEANELLTPADVDNSYQFEIGADGASSQPFEYPVGIKKPGIVLDTNAAALLLVPVGTQSHPPAESKTPKALATAIQRPPLPSKSSGVQKAVSAFFRRSCSRSSSNTPNLFVAESDALLNNAWNPTLNQEHRKPDITRISGAVSPNSSRSNTPETPIEDSKSEARTSLQEPSIPAFLEAQNKNGPLRGFSFRESLSRHRVTFVTPEKADKVEFELIAHRSTSLDQDHAVPFTDPEALLPPRSIWSIAADAGVGLKSRRLSLNLPDDFAVEIVDLYSEFADQSKLVGRWGKSIGKGATARVRLMNRKGGHPGEVFAVKEFRGKSSKESADDHEKKVKSEYSIAKSLRHPNIVETIRLCTHNGQWNQVMEFCDQGDLFGLVSQKYLSKEKHLTDRLCLFKQLIQGLNYLHAHGIAHRDVKLENLLITRDSKLKITDFGVSEVFSGIHPGLRIAGGQCGMDMSEARLCDPGMCGSPPYVAPEVFGKKNKYDPRPLDVWGAAIVMLCMTANGFLWDEARIGSSPLYDDLVKGWNKWNAKHVEDYNVGITETDYPYVSFFDQHINPPALRRMLLTLLNPDPSKRVSMATVAKNRWLKHVECCQIDSYVDPTTDIDATQLAACKKLTKIVQHNHLPPASHLSHRLVRLPGSFDMF